MEIPSCEHCGARRRMMVGMAAGKDGQPWWLCPRCWEDGLRTMHGTTATPAEPPKQAKPSKVARGSQSTIPRPQRPADPEPTDEPRSQHRFTGGTGTYVPDDDGYW